SGLDPVHDRRRRRADPAQRDRAVHVHRADAQRGQPRAGHVRAHQRHARRPDHGVLRHGGGRGRGRGRPGDHHVHLPDSALGKRRRREPAEVLKERVVQNVAFAAASGWLGSFWLLIAIPLASAAVLLLLGKRADRWGHWLGVLSVGVAFVLGLTYFFTLKGSSNRHGVELKLFDFFHVGALKVDFGLLYDPLSAVFVLLITGVGFLIHVYAVGYMAHDSGRRRFFGYFNLFVAAMLLLVLGNNYLMLYVGWEGVGLASYLLISFWYDRPSAATAGKKAFIMNRVGDVGLLLAMFMMVATFGSLNFADVFSGVGKAGSTTVLMMGLLLLLGACGKSGQFPLQAWLPDAMEGPTPVSALIHAATMVTAGVYLIARSNPIFSASPNAQSAVVFVGALTLLIGAIIGCAKDDIKRVLAYSTVSQIGYM